MDTPADQQRFEEALKCEETQRFYSQVARAVDRRGMHRGPFDTGRSQPIDAPPCSLPPLV